MKFDGHACLDHTQYNPAWTIKIPSWAQLFGLLLLYPCKENRVYVIWSELSERFSLSGYEHVIYLLRSLFCGQSFTLSRRRYNDNGPCQTRALCVCQGYDIAQPRLELPSHRTPYAELSLVSSKCPQSKLDVLYSFLKHVMSIPLDNKPSNTVMKWGRTISRILLNSPCEGDIGVLLRMISASVRVVEFVWVRSDTSEQAGNMLTGSPKRDEILWIWRGC